MGINIMKIRCILSALLVALSLQTVAFASSETAVDLVYDHVLPSHDEPRARAKWARLSKQELDAVLKTTVPLRTFAFYAGFKFKGNGDILVFRFIKPVLIENGGFCRSDVALYQVHGYKPGLTFDKQSVTTIGHLGELVSFQEEGVEDHCEVNSFEDLDRYTFVDSFLADQTVAELWKVYMGMLDSRNITPNCTLRENTRLSEVSIGVLGGIDSKHYYSFFIKNGSDLTSVTFTLEGNHPKVKECVQNLIF